MIDWVKVNSEDKWQAQNITELNTWGVEFSSNINMQHLITEDFFIKDISIKYAYLEMDKSSSEFISRSSIFFPPNSAEAKRDIKPHLNLPVSHLHLGHQNKIRKTAAERRRKYCSGIK